MHSLVHLPIYDIDGDWIDIFTPPIHLPKTTRCLLVGSLGFY